MPLSHPGSVLERYADVIFVCGGRTALLWCYAPQKDIWYQLPDMLLEHKDHAVVQYRDKICIFGGKRVGPVKSQIIEYFFLPITPRGQFKQDLVGMIVLVYQFYMVASLHYLERCMGDSIILYKIDDNVCEAVADPPTGRDGACLVSDKRHLYLVGGSHNWYSFQGSQTVERFDPILATWEEVAAMNEARYKAFGAATKYMYEWKDLRSRWHKWKRGTLYSIEVL